MQLLRSLIYFLFLTFSTVLCSLVIALAGWFLPFSWNSAVAGGWGAANLWALKWICGLDYQLRGAENIPKQNALVLSKHQSAWETIALRWLLPFHQSWVLKRELMWVPIFGWALAVVKPIAIDRQSGRKAVKQVVREGIDRLQKGQFVIIFPEGTRVAPGEKKKYGIGGALLASKSGYPVLPIAHNAGVYWRRRGLIKHPGTIQVVIGPTIETKGLSASEINSRVETWIETTMAELPG
ncbi:MAG: 1-acyl-sn-glycerol-3-phosphate acyltransferase [Gammaproteobacteria bacterium]|nr:1-acyl-sn-glycerol-3-phosphate acyltransferase [Gammaproteobacteria bacterium]